MAYSEELATATIAMEASGEGAIGELDVAFVLVNRQKDGRWGDNLAQVVLSPEQFSSWNTKDPNRIRLAKMKNADPVLEQAQDAFRKAFYRVVDDPTLGATHYYSVDMPEPPSWAATGHFLIQKGKHRFYNSVP